MDNSTKTFGLGTIGLSPFPTANQSEKLYYPMVRDGISSLEEGNYAAASKAFGMALKFDPQKAGLHLLNALSYHLAAEAGDSSQYEMSEVGYKVALQFDSGSYMAAYHLGIIKMYQRRYREAQDNFAYALLFEPENTDILLGLAAASYYAQDLKTSVSTIERALKLRPDDPYILRASVMIYAAIGETVYAANQLEKYRNISGSDNYTLDRLSRRLKDWQRFYKQNPFVRLANDTSDVIGSDASDEGLGPSGGEDDSDDSSSEKSPVVSKSKMVLVDVVIIRSEERLITGKGVNFLNGLQIIFGGSGLTYEKDNATSKGAPSVSSRSVTQQFFIKLPDSGIPYSLNIFNDNNDHNEVLARPSLIASDGKESEFFSGALFHVELQGVVGSEGTVSDVPIGIRLKFTPSFIDDSTVEFHVEAGRAFIEARADSIGFNNFTQTSKTLVTSNVTMRFGETLVLSGLSEREDEKIKDGVPFLQNIPGLQYMFSREDTLSFKKSVLVLMTPHKPRYVHQDGTPKISPAKPADLGANKQNLNELTGRNDWFQPAANLDVVFEHLKDGSLYKEFRSGDIKMEKWDKPGDLKELIKRTLGFLYY